MRNPLTDLSPRTVEFLIAVFIVGILGTLGTCYARTRAQCANGTVVRTAVGFACMRIVP